MKKMILALALLFMQLYVIGQSITGKIVDNKHQAIYGAYIFNLSNERHAHSDQEGKFKLEKVNIGDTIAVTHLGFEIEEAIIDSSISELDFVLKPKSISLEEVVIAPKVDALNVISDIDVQTKPVNSSQEILRQLPGLFIGQHAGGGKAEQIFLRGFDIDHGTDINISVDGMPVNMVSHAHGQGYADLHFIIPETIDKIDFGKGAYYADQGNFNTAGYVDFRTKRKLDNSLIKMELGQFNTMRLLSMINLLNKEKKQAYLTSEYLSSNGPFESSQNFKRLNIFGKYNGSINNGDHIGLTLSHFTSEWDASGQIPQRAVDNNTITRFGAIDDTEGGNTARTNVQLTYTKPIRSNAFVKNNFYFTNYQFELFSNFTFFLEDSINGDQIKQKESRNLFGLNSEYHQSFSNDVLNADWQLGINWRTDQSNNNELSRTLNRKTTLEEIQFGNIFETNIGAYANANINWGKWTLNSGLRIDHFDFQYKDALQENYQTQSANKTIISPKLNLLYNYSNRLQFYLKSGKGFHSNDTRVVLEGKTDNSLPASYGYDLGLMSKPFSKLFINLAYWQLFLEQEFVYVGDAGIVEPSGETLRQGVDLSIRYQTLKYLFWNIDLNYAHARSIEDEIDNDYIPLAPNFSMTSGLSLVHPAGWYGSINMRHLHDRPANEDNSIIAKGYTVFDMNFGRNWEKYSLDIQAQNLFNTEWNETQFATESRLQNEAAPVEEIHFTPGAPLFIKGTLTYKF